MDNKVYNKSLDQEFTLDQVRNHNIAFEAIDYLLNPNKDNIQTAEQLTEFIEHVKQQPEEYFDFIHEVHELFHTLECLRAPELNQEGISYSSSDILDKFYEYLAWFSFNSTGITTECPEDLANFADVFDQLATRLTSGFNQGSFYKCIAVATAGQYFKVDTLLLLKKLVLVNVD